MFKKFLALSASYASIVGLLFYWFPREEDWPGWAIALVVIAVLSLGIFVFLELVNRRRCHVYDKSDKEGIKNYMHDWIEHGSRVAIWTRDMSWAQNPETRTLLMAKAGNGELILCLPRVIPLAAELEKAGAEVYAHSAEQFEFPASRFTIADFGRVGSRVAVGRAEEDAHVIDEFSAKGQPAFHLAEDLVKLVRSLPPGNTG